MAKESSLEPYVKALKYKLRARTIPGKIANVFEELGYETKSGQKPVQVKATPTDYGYYIIYHLPAAISWRKVEADLYYFEEQVDGTIEIDHKGPNIFLEVMTKEFDAEIPYIFEPKPKNSKEILLPLGYTLDGKFHTINLPDIPHLLDVGNTRAGKTNSLHVFSISLLKQNVMLCIIDRAKAEFSYLRGHAIVANEEEEARNLLALLIKVAQTRYKKMETFDCFKWQEYEGNDMPYVVLIIDELGSMDDKESQEHLKKLAQICAGAGMSIILATQRPSATTFKNFTDIRALFPGVLTFAIKDRVNSQLILDNDHATKIPKKAKGRAIFQWDDEVMLQTMFLPSKEAREIVKTLPRLTMKGDFGIEPSRKRLPPR